MNFWHTVEAGWFSEALLENRDILSEYNHLCAPYLLEYGWTRRRAWLKR